MWGPIKTNCTYYTKQERYKKNLTIFKQLKHVKSHSHTVKVDDEGMEIFFTVFFCA